MAREVVAIVDADDTVVGAATRSHMRRHRLWHRAVYVVVSNSAGQILIHQRTASKDVFPSYWDIAFGGVLAADESYDEAAERELFEEAGLSSTHWLPLFPVRYEDGDCRVLGQAYRVTTDEEPRLQESEVARTRWVELRELPDLIRTEKFCPDGLVLLDRLLG